MLSSAMHTFTYKAEKELHFHLHEFIYILENIPARHCKG